MALLDDIGYTPPKQTEQSSGSGGLLADIGYKEPKTQEQKEPEVSAHPVTDEVLGTVKNIVTEAPRQLATGVGNFLDALGTAGGGMGPLPTSMNPQQNVENAKPHPIVTAAANEIADRLGIPKIDQSNSISKDVGAGIRAIPGALAFGPEGVLPSMASGAASQEAENRGAGPIGQMAAGMVPFAPSAAAGAVRGAVRGIGEDAATNMQNNISMADEAGLNLSAGQLSGRVRTQAVETASSHLPGGGPLANTRGHALNDQVDARVSDIVQKLAPDTPKTATSAGEVMNTGVAKSREAMANDEDLAYQKVENLVGKDTPMEAKNFAAMSTKLANPTGIPEVDRLLSSPEMSTAEKAGIASVTPKQAPSYNPEWNSFQSTPTPKPPLTFGNLRDMRARIGNQIDWGMTPSNPGKNAELKQIYGALTEDIKSGVKAVSPEAQQALSDANALYKANSQKRELLDKVVDKIGGPEAVYKAATNGTKDGATKISTVMDQLDEGSRNVVRATVLNRLGHVGEAVDAPFDSTTFLKKWDALAPEAKDALFGTGEMKFGIRRKLDALTDGISLLQRQGYLKGGLATGVAQGNHGVMNGVMALLAERAAEVGYHIASGNPLRAAASVVGGGTLMAINPVLSRALTNPTTVGWLAQATKAPKGMLPVLFNQLDHINDPDAKSLKELIAGYQSK